MAGKIEVWGTKRPPSFKLLWRADGLCPPNLGHVCLWFWLFFCFIHHGTPTGSFLETCVKIRLDLAEVFRILKCLFVYLFVYWFVCFYFNNLGAPTGSYPENLERSDFIWLIYLGSKKCLFVHFFVCLLVCLFLYINHLGIPTGIYPQNFMKIWHDLAEMYRI